MKADPVRFLDLLNQKIQYVVPRWQRRYRWGESEITRLVEDLLAVGQAEEADHYGGSLLTFPEPGQPGGVLPTTRVVDGQQRLTTVSILLSCIAESLETGGRQHNGWTAENIREELLTNPRRSPERHRKLRLQQGDDEEYRAGLEGEPRGSGAVTQAWKVVRRLVGRSDPTQLFQGLERFQIVSIGLHPHDDPQQIFESINATGLPLAESEKVKNWLLMGQPDGVQRDLHDNHWLLIEKSLGASHTTEPIDLFLRDVLRWHTGELRGKDQAYEGLRRWALREHGASLSARASICRELARLAQLYGVLTGSAGLHRDRRVELELRHLRALGLDVHRPLSLRLLDDASKDDPTPTNLELAKVLDAIGTWLTRMWLAERPMAGINKAAAELANMKGPGPDQDYVDYWKGQIRRRQNTRVGVPNDEDVIRGVRNRKAHGGTATRSSTAVLCALMEAEHGEESPARKRLTIEHVMPQKLTSAWIEALGDNAAETHERWLHRLANLTLSGDVTNVKLGTGTFKEKCSIYEKSPIGLTREIAAEDQWDREALERRAGVLAERALKRWPWQGQGPETAPSDTSGPLEWRIEDGLWRAEGSASQMVLNLAGALLRRNPKNAKRLSGDTLSKNLQSARQYPPGSKAGSLTMRAVPGHDDWVLYPYDRDYAASAKRCREMGNVCDVTVEVRGFQEIHRRTEFFRFLKKRTGGLPGQTDAWRGEQQWTRPLNSHGDRVGLRVGDKALFLFIRKAWGQESSADLAARLLRYSGSIRSGMGDQRIEGEPHAESLEGRTVSVKKPWAYEDDEDWPPAADWIKDQYERLRTILKDLEHGTEPE